MMRAISDLDRRQFVKSAMAVAFGGAMHSMATAPALAADPVPSASQFIPGKDKRLIVHSVKTGEIETPLSLLRDYQITSKEILFVRNNQALSGSLSLDANRDRQWLIRLSGLIDKTISISVNDIEKLEQRDLTMVLQCSGNGRSRFAASKKAEGVQWEHGAMGNVTFRGVRLQDVLQAKAITISERAKFITAEGMDVPLMEGSADFEHSLPLEVALGRSLLALAMNGEPIPRVHGGPVRLITPGYYGTMHVKWLGAIRFEPTESSNYHHVGRYRTPIRPLVPGSEFVSTLENSEPNWDMRIKNVIFSPLSDTAVKSGNLEIRGVAWNDGQTRIESVHVSLDGGASWRRAELTQPTSPYAWHHWRLEVQVAPGRLTILSRATDVMGRAQPLDGSVGWNPAGYAWNGVDSVTIGVG